MDLTIPEYEEFFQTILPNKLPIELVDIIKDYTYNFDEILIYHGLVMCIDCHNIWDGNAQCNCWQWIQFDDISSESDIEEENNQHLVINNYELFS